MHAYVHGHMHIGHSKKDQTRDEREWWGHPSTQTL